MTANQINLANYRENYRHNRATEGENVRHNKRTEDISQQQTNENVRHNVSYEGIQRSGIQETARHNVQTENINWYSAQHLGNLQNAQASLATSDVGQRARQNAIAERNNLMNYDIQSQNIANQSKQAQAALQQAANTSKNLTIQQQIADETHRHNQQTETQAAVNNATGAITSIWAPLARLVGAGN